MEHLVINAEGVPMGRVASFAAKQGLFGKRISVVNCEKAVISGNRAFTLAKYKQKKASGGSAIKGPFYSRSTDKMMKRSIRGMLPNFRLGRGKAILKMIKCYNGIPEEFKKDKLVDLKIDTPNKHMTLEEVGRLI